MPTVRLTQKVVDTCELPDGQKVWFLWDASLAGFGLRVTASRKSYVAQFRRADNRTCRVRIAQTDHRTIDEARQSAWEIISSGGSSLDQQDLSVLNNMNVGQLMALFISEYVEKRHKPTTVKEEKRLIDKMILTELSSVLLSQLSRKRLIAWHSKQTAHISANRALAHLSKACSFAIQRGMIEHNPCVGIERNKEVAKDRYFTDEELERIGAVLRHTTVNKFVHDGLILLALTGLRLSEVRLLRKDNFDINREIIELRDTKIGKRYCSISPECNEYIISRLGEINPQQLVPMTAHGFSKSISFILTKAKIKNASAHTFRHTYATFMAQHGASVFQIMAACGWKSISMAQRYVSLHGIGTPHPLPASTRIAKALGLT